MKIYFHWSSKTLRLFGPKADFKGEERIGRPSEVNSKIWTAVEKRVQMESMAKRAEGKGRLCQSSVRERTRTSGYQRQRARRKTSQKKMSQRWGVTAGSRRLWVQKRSRSRARLVAVSRSRRTRSPPPVWVRTRTEMPRAPAAWCTRLGTEKSPTSPGEGAPLKWPMTQQV